ncbi:disease resistance protein Roq1-like [Gastrolobium bilobum]|uniref:disease resistance protein Roq1-like n=1 Tax=Gastrolobium bilobum TaxID=150636 RepID=UPI002AB210EC|nr:disease resistance protein Roq1-like [Gastrolobium bilobum]
MAVQAFSSSFFTYGFSFDVFLSFKGTDTRYGFTGNLYKTLQDKGIHTFIDDEELQRGEEITPSLLRAIEESRIAIIILSENYASSSFCLDELSKIIDCIKGNGRLVLPVFYEVDPSDVRKQRGTFGEAMAMHGERFNDNMNKLLKWRMALQQVANLSGYHYKHGEGYEYEFIEKIVELVSSKINRAPLHVADYPIGLESRVLHVKSLLDVGNDDGVHMVGIHGIGGIGKTTLVLTIYNLIADHFDGLCFLENVRENSNKKGLKHLQQVILSEMFRGRKIKLTSVKQGISIIQHRLQQKKVLLILDDVNKIEQLEALAGGSNWFGPGSRVIITARDKHLLASHGVERTYEINGLNKTEALELLRWNAFKNNKVDPSYKDILNRAATYACGLPLALEVIGSNLFGKSIEDWKSALNYYERIPNKEIQKILKLSFDALEEEEKSVFLDIACCFKGYQFAEVKDILHAHYGECMKYHIGVLAERSLIKISSGWVRLHDLIEDMGKEIVRRKSPKEPGKRSRLWFSEDIFHVLEKNTGTNAIEIIYLDFPLFGEEEVIVQWNGKAFENMKNLKTLVIRKGHFSKGPEHLPNSLRVLEWQRFPSQHLPSDFLPKKLAICKLPKGCFTSLELVVLLKKFVRLKVLDFDECEGLTQIPDVSGLPNLEKFSFEGCVNLITIHDSVGFLDKLKILNANGCTRLGSFPPIKLSSLEQLDLSCCSSLQTFPEIIGKIENIKYIDFYETPIKELPLVFQNITQLQELFVSDCGIVQLTSVVVMKSELTVITGSDWKKCLFPKEDEVQEIMVSSNVEYLQLEQCNLLDEFHPIGFTWFANVKDVKLSGIDYTNIPEGVKECRFMSKLNLDDCKHLKEMKEIPPNLIYFYARSCKSSTSSSRSMLQKQEIHEAGNTMFVLGAARIPKWFNHHSKGPSISFWFRNKFPAIALCLVMDNVSNDFTPVVIINGDIYDNNNMVQMDQTYLYDMQKKKPNHNRVPLENEWNHVEVTCEFWKKNQKIPILKESGIHVFKQKTKMVVVRFTNPYRNRKLDDNPNSSESQNHPLLKKHKFVDTTQ